MEILITFGVVCSYFVFGLVWLGILKLICKLMIRFKITCCGEMTAGDWRQFHSDSCSIGCYLCWPLYGMFVILLFCIFIPIRKVLDLVTDPIE
jgi:hypothetical protein